MNDDRHLTLDDADMDPLGEDEQWEDKASGNAPDAPEDAATARGTREPHRGEDSVTDARRALLAALPSREQSIVIDYTRELRDDDPLWALMYALHVTTTDAAVTRIDEATARIQGVRDEIEEGRAEIEAATTHSREEMRKLLRSFGRHATGRIQEERQALQRVVDDAFRDAVREVAAKRSTEVMRVFARQTLWTVIGLVGIGICLGLGLAMLFAAAGRLGAL